LHTIAIAKALQCSPGVFTQFLPWSQISPPVAAYLDLSCLYFERDGCTHTSTLASWSNIARTGVTVEAVKPEFQHSIARVESYTWYKVEKLLCRSIFIRSHF